MSNPLTVSELEAAAQVAIALVHAEFPAMEFDEGSFKLGFVDGAAYMCNLMKEKMK